MPRLMVLVDQAGTGDDTQAVATSGAAENRDGAGKKTQ